ncbi:MAG: hypothetical protein D6731_13200 [Planctomycetota bacterium]|nr:MAG: hypothetical protein D6731_13200 [Planctomycetota bacterium]
MSLPRACWAAIRSAPPASRARARSSSSFCSLGSDTAPPRCGAPFYHTARAGRLLAAGREDRVSEHDLQTPAEGADRRPCPYCGEAIRAEAIKCRHCGERLEGGKRPRGQASQQIEQAATLSLVFGLISLLVCQCLAPLAIIKGNEAARLAAASREPTPGTATAGKVLGWISLAIVGLSVLVYGGVIAFALVAGTAGGGPGGAGS